MIICCTITVNITYNMQLCSLWLFSMTYYLAVSLIEDFDEKTDEIDHIFVIFFIHILKSHLLCIYKELMN